MMSTFKALFKALVAIVATVLPITALAQTTDQSESSALRGRHDIEISIGFLSQLSATSEVSVAGLTMTSEAGGFIGSLVYGYWFADEWAVNLSVGVANADASMSVSGRGVSMESAVVIPVLFGVRYEPLRLAIGDALRPYVSVSLGPHLGFASDVRAGTTSATESYSEAAIGARAAAGIQLSLSRRFTLGFAVGYRLVSDFERRIGSKENHSSPEFSLSLGVVIGRGKE